MIIQILLLLMGLVLLVKGADWLVEGASAIAKKFNISNLAIGLTVVAFGTSVPELVVNAYASIQNHQEIVFGNIIGSNIFNLFAILGIAGLISPMIVQSTTLWKEIPISLLAVVVLFFLCNDFLFGETNSLSRINGFVLLAMFVLFLIYVYTQLKNTSELIEESVEPSHSNLKLFFYVAGGLTGLIVGGNFVVDNAVSIATLLGINEQLIGLTIVAIGTSLPELATSVLAATKKKNDIAIGNIVGSNIFNIFLILGVSSVIRPLNYDNSLNFELYLLGGGTLLLFVFLMIGNKLKLDRWKAFILLLVYVFYTIYLVQKMI